MSENACGVCGREEHLPPDWARLPQPDQCWRKARENLDWYAADCYRLGCARLSTALSAERTARVMAERERDDVRTRYTEALGLARGDASRAIVARQRMREALEWLVRLKEGPRGDKYRFDKPKAWAAARAALAAEPGEG